MTLQEIQYKAQGIIHKWRDNDSAPYIEFVEELAHMTVPEPSEDLEEAAEEYLQKVKAGFLRTLEHPTAKDCFIHGAKWQAEQLLKSSPLPEDTVLFNKGVKEGKRLMTEEAVEADVNIYRDLAAGTSWAEFVVEMPTNNLGDKVRVIVLKKED